MNKEAYKAPETKLYEALFGASEQPSRARTSKRLGAQQVITLNSKEDLFTSTFFMGGNLQMNAIIDTATDFNAVNSVNCPTCGSDQKYDIEANLANGSAFLDQDIVTETYGKSEFIGR